MGRASRVLVLLCALPAAALPAPPSVEALQRAAALVEEGRLDEAERQARLALADPEAKAVACSVLGAIRLRQERLPESAKLLEEAIQLEPRLLGAHLTLGQVYTQQGRSARALDIFGRALKLDPNNATARLALARAATEKGQYARALELAQPVLEAFRESPEGLFVLATTYMKMGNRPAAAGLARDWARLDDLPDASSVQFAALLAEGGLAGEAASVLESARRTDSGSYEVVFALGGAYVASGDPGRALEAYDLALALQPDSLTALRQAAAVAERNGELERSLSYWLRARKLASDDADILLGFGRVCLKMDLLEDAEPALTQAAAKRPRDPRFQYALAAVKVGKKQHEAAQAVIEPLVAARPDDAQLQYALGSVLYIQGHLDDAAARLEESLRLQPEQLASRYNLALIARDQGRESEAAASLEDLLQRYPAHAPSYEALGGLLMNERRYPEAERLYRKAVELDPGSVKANYQLGLLLARMGRKEESEAQLERAKTLRQEDEESSRLQRRLLDPDLK
jgi:tetratricopeptide (TPR) repeat protein